MVSYTTPSLVQLYCTAVLSSSLVPQATHNVQPWCRTPFPVLYSYTARQSCTTVSSHSVALIPHALDYSAHSCAATHNVLPWCHTEWDVQRPVLRSCRVQLSCAAVLCCRAHIKYNLGVTRYGITVPSLVQLSCTAVFYSSRVLQGTQKYNLGVSQYGITVPSLVQLSCTAFLYSFLVQLSCAAVLCCRGHIKYNLGVTQHGVYSAQSCTAVLYSSLMLQGTHKV